MEASFISHFCCCFCYCTSTIFVSQFLGSLYLPPFVCKYLLQTHFARQNLIYLTRPAKYVSTKVFLLINKPDQISRPATWLKSRNKWPNACQPNGPVETKSKNLFWDLIQKNKNFVLVKKMPVSGGELRLQTDQRAETGWLDGWLIISQLARKKRNKSNW